MPITSVFPATAEGRTVAVARLTSVLLLFAGLGAVLAAVIGVACPHVPGTLDAVTPAAWVVVLPGVLAVCVSVMGPMAGLAVVAGAGVAGVAKLLADLFVLLQPASVARPELLYPLSARALPLRSAGGAWLLVLADLLAVLAGVLAARALAGRTGIGAAGGGNEIRFDDAASDAHRLDGLGADAQVPAVRNVPMLIVGFIAIAIFGFSAVQSSYSGGYIDMMLSVPGSDAGTVIAPFLLAFVAMGAVVLAGSLPRAAAVALLAGIAAAVAVPALTAMVVATGSAPVQVSSSVTAVLIGSLVLVFAGLLTRAGRRSAAPDRANAMTSMLAAATGTVAVRWAAIGLGLLAGLLLISASQLDLLSGSGPASTIAAEGAPVNGRTGLTLLLAGVAMLLSGIAAVVGRGAIAAAGLSGLTVCWGATIWALAGPISELGKYRAGTDQAEQTFATAALTPQQRTALDATIAHWSIGPGMWLTVVAAAAAVVAAVLAGVALARQSDEVAVVPDDDSAEASARLRRLVAAGLALVAVIGLALPLSSINGVSTAALFSLGATASWAGWAVLAAVLIALVIGATASDAAMVLGAVVAAAAVLLVYSWAPADVRAAAGYAAGPGSVAGWILIALLLGGALMMWRSARNVGAVDFGPAGVGVAAVDLAATKPNASENGLR